MNASKSKITVCVTYSFTPIGLCETRKKKPDLRGIQAGRASWGTVGGAI